MEVGREVRKLLHSFSRETKVARGGVEREQVAPRQLLWRAEKMHLNLVVRNVRKQQRLEPDSSAGRPNLA